MIKLLRQKNIFMLLNCLPHCLTIRHPLPRIQILVGDLHLFLTFWKKSRSKLNVICIYSNCGLHSIPNFTCAQHCFTCVCLRSEYWRKQRRAKNGSATKANYISWKCVEKVAQTTLPNWFTILVVNWFNLEDFWADQTVSPTILPTIWPNEGLRNIRKTKVIQPGRT